MPRILFLNRYFYPDHSATSQILSDLAFHLADDDDDDDGHEVHVITSRQIYDNPAATLASNETARGVHVHRVTTTRFGRATLIGRALDYLSCYRGMYRAIIKLASTGDTIVAKTDPPLLSVIAAYAARRKGARLINWLQDLYPDAAVALRVPLMRGPLAALLTWLRNNSLQRAALNVVPGDSMMQRLIAAGTPSSKIVIIPNWTDDAAIVPLAHASNPLRRDWGLADKFVVGYSGNLGRAHDFDTMLAAAEQLRDHPRIVFVLIGGGSQRDVLIDQVRRRNLVNTVRFFPYQERHMLQFSLAVPDVHWLSLRPELEGIIMPSKFYGIAAAGRPMIALASPDGDIAALIKRYRCGFTVTPGDAGQFAETLTTLAADPAQCAELGRRARVLIDTEFTQRHAFERWRRALADLP